ncbi:MAG TPA: hypothetical protein PKE25_10365, partial [Novosphingobium sp.]|nr:hypothetical protein [Novosphingobium sp.]
NRGGRNNNRSPGGQSLDGQSRDQHLYNEARAGARKATAPRGPLFNPVLDPDGEARRAERPAREGGRGERPRSDRPRSDRPQGDRPQGDRPRSDRPRSDRPQGERSGKPGAKPSGGQFARRRQGV